MIEIHDEHVPAVLSEASCHRREHRTRSRRQQFLKGPVPMSWLERAAVLPGKALAIALVIWFQRGLTRKDYDIAVGNALGRRVGAGRKARYRALQALEDAGLISVTRRRGAAPRVTILDPGAAVEVHRLVPPEPTRRRCNNCGIVVE